MSKQPNGWGPLLGPHPPLGSYLANRDLVDLRDRLARQVLRQRGEVHVGGAVFWPS